MFSRRDTLKTMGALTVAGALPTGSVLAAAPTDKRLVVIVLRGGADGLGLVPAIGDPGFDSIRGALGDGATPRGPSAHRLDSTFGLHGVFDAAHRMWQEGDLSIAHAVHSPSRNRSHFDAQDMLEIGLDRLNSTADGWMNRALSWFDADENRRLGLASGYGMPLILRGPQKVRVWSPRRMREANSALLVTLALMGTQDTAFQKAFREGADTIERDSSLLGHDAQTSHPSTRDLQAVSQLARATGKFLSAPEGPRFATFDIEGWDSHGSQNIYLSYRVPLLDGALASLKQGLGSAWQDTVVAVVTEFGRTARPNGTTGTDHGTAAAALLAGGAVRGGVIHSDWPGLRDADLYEGRDLKPTMDIRSVFKAILIQHMRIDPDFVERVVFPNSAAAREIARLV